VLHSRYRLVACLIGSAVVLNWAQNASALCVASYAGPTTFDGVDDFVVLPNVSIGLEGTVSLEFKADDTAGMHGIWYLCDAPGGVNAEYRINLTNNTVWAELWPAGCSSGFGVDFPLTDKTSWHAVSLTWKDGVDTVLRFDGAEGHFPIAYEDGTPMSLPEFTSPTGCHALGYSMQSGPTAARYFDGQIRNLYVYDTYQAPEPSVVALMITGLAAYAWRRRR
jgi:hypothetical protein